MSCKHALLRHKVFTLLHQTLSKKALKKQIIPKFPQKQTKNPPLETSKPENMLKMNHVRSKKAEMSKKQKGSWFWEILLREPRVICLKLSFLTDIKNLFLK